MTSLAMFEDVKEILDQALASGGGEVTLASPGQAVRWRQRAYQFRKLMRGKVDYSIYDRLTLNKLEDGSAVVTIKVIQQAAVFAPAADGIPVKLPEPTLKKPSARLRKVATTDDLQEAADAIAEKLKGDIF